MNENKSSTSTYVELNALEMWSSRMNSINTEAIEILNKLDSVVKNSEDCWVGTSASSFRKASDELISNAKRCHTNMSDLPKLLNTIASTMDSE